MKEYIQLIAVMLAIAAVILGGTLILKRHSDAWHEKQFKHGVGVAEQCIEHTSVRYCATFCEELYLIERAEGCKDRLLQELKHD